MSTNKNKSSIEESSDDETNDQINLESKVTRSGSQYGSRDEVKVTAVIHSDQENGNSEATGNTGNSQTKKDKTKRIKALQLRIQRLRLEEELAKLQNNDKHQESERDDSSTSDSENHDEIEIIQQDTVETSNSTKDMSQDTVQMSSKVSMSEMMNLQTKFMEEMIKQQQQNALALSLPSTEVPIFHGDPIEYNPFISAFENIIEKKTQDNSSRLYYLIQYTSGEVKEVLQSCLPMNSEEGYKEARIILKKRYGQNYRIASAHVEKLLNSPSIKSEDGKGLMKLATMLTTCKNTLKEMNYISQIENPDTLRKIIGLLPFEVRRRWRTVADSISEREDREIKIEDIVMFVEKEARVTTHPVFGDITSKQTSSQDKKPVSQPPKKSSFLAQAQKNCSICGTASRHQLEECQKFRQQSLQERQKTVMMKGLCFICLCHGHRSRDCTTLLKCGKCNGRHHVLLHQEKADFKNVTNHKKQDDKTETMHVKSAFMQNSKERSLIGLPIVPVKIMKHGMNDSHVIVNALLDNCSNSTFCTDRLLKKLGKPGRPTTISLNTIDKENSLTNSMMTNLQVYDMDEVNMIDLPTVLTRPSIPVSKEDIPTQEDIRRWPHLHGIRLPEVDAEVELLIGNDNIVALEPKEIRKSKDGGPYAVRTNLGWAINGPVGRTSMNKKISNLIKCQTSEDGLTQQFKEFCNREFNDSLIEINKEMSQEDKRALTMMEETIRLKGDNHYEVGLPWREYPPQLPDNKVLAEHRLHLLKRRLLTDPNLFKKYGDFMDDLIHNGYAEEVDEYKMKSDVPNWYLPHHSVFNPYKPLKTRVVFDCSAKFKNVSLNDCLLQGPNLTNTLIGVLSRFRLHKYVCMADISSMYHMVTVPEESRNALRFLWWPDKDLHRQPAIYRMTVHCFGMVSSPSCCNFALRQIAEDNEIDKEVQDCIRRHFYVDDFLKSFKTVEEAKNVSKDLCRVLSNGGFKLTKWVSNSQDILDSIPEDKRAVTPQKDQLFEDNQIERTLGIRWNVSTDSFGFNISIKPRPATRRGILSTMSSVFDPLGFVSPCILPAKKILQDLCKLNYEWDAPIPEEYHQQWNKWLTELPKLSKFKIKRCFVPDDFGDVTRYELHHMSDASEIGYGSVSYLRMLNSRNQVNVAFLIGKSRLAPLKKISIPRLELSAATVSVRLDKMMRQELDLNIERSVFWTDSTSVLKYVRNETKRFHTFVANRIATIRNGSDPSNWHYVDSRRNSSDDSSRGLIVGEFIKNQRWILGPGFLYLPEHQWPVEPDIKEGQEEVDPEIKTEKKCNLVINNGVDTMNDILTRFSSWFQLKRCIAYLLRYKRNLLRCIKGDNQQPKKVTQRSTQIQPLSLYEIKAAEEEIIKNVQQKCFPEEYKTLLDKSTNGVKKSSNIIKLDPVLFEDNLIRVGGRLRNSNYSTDFKHPIILPKKHHISDLIIRHYHHLSGHSGREYILSLMRRTFWIVNSNSAVRSVLSKCISCKKRQAQPLQQKLADLPKDRVTAEKPPFSSVGIDFFGPFMVKRGRNHSLKRYGCIFTCLAIRAIHIEVTETMNTDSFINALRRFIARRGSPEEIRSDNGSNFVGGCKELKSAIKEWNQKRINDFLLNKEVKWIFNTPAASHHGGVWERCIRTIRKVLNALLKEQVLDEEGLSTLMCEVESIVNGRPLSSVSDDVNDLEALTPNHILLMKSSPPLPPGLFVKRDLYVRKKWRQVQYMADIFWTRWKSEYLPLLQKRQKWFKAKENIKIGDIILMMEDSSPRSAWPLARVIGVKQGEDGLIRSVKVKTKTSTFERPVTKCILLESVQDE